MQIRSFLVAAAAAATLSLAAFSRADVTGQCKLDGTAPEQKKIDMSAVPECAAMHPDPVSEEKIVADDKGDLANVVVSIKKDDSPNLTGPVPKDPAVIDQKGCMYEPHVLGVMAYEDVKFTNSDSINHNIHPLPRTNQEWNESQPAGSPAIIKRFTRPEVMMPIKCNVHPWMRAFAFVFSHPYFAVTTTTGTFDLTNLPPGTYTIEAWQEKYGVQDQTITIDPKESKAISFTFKAAGSAAN